MSSNRHDSTTSAAESILKGNIAKQKLKKKKSKKSTVEDFGDENNFRRFMQFVFKSTDEGRPIPPLYVVFYSKNEYRAFKR